MENDAKVFTKDGKYELWEVLGEGGFGIVYRARRIETDQPVAVKVIRPQLLLDDPQAKRRFLREAKLVARLNHPHIIKLIELSPPGDDELYAAYELIEGQSLASYLRVKGTLRPGFALALMSQVLEALAHAHKQNITHRDLKPDNIMVSFGNMGSIHITILDFGIATISQESRGGDRDLKTITAQGDMPGTPAYMSREQIISPQRSRLLLTYMPGVSSSWSASRAFRQYEVRQPEP